MEPRACLEALRRAICVLLAVTVMVVPRAHAQDSAEAWIDVIVSMSLQVANTAAGGTELGSAGLEIISIGLSLPKIGLCALVDIIKLREDKLRDDDAVQEIFSGDPRVDELDLAYRRLSTATVGVCQGSQQFPVEPITSGDPNDKAGSKGVGSQQYVSGATPLRYAVQFGNEPTASAAAQKIVVTDPLDLAHDDLTTLRFGPISFGHTFVTPPSRPGDFATTVDLRPTTNLGVIVNSHLDASSGLLTWTLQSVDPATFLPPTDPTAGFLPPGVDGGVFFTVMPKQGLPTNTQVQNQGTVVFDANAPINTPTWMNTLDNTSPTSRVVELPATEGATNFSVQWTGSDVGAGIQDFTIFVSDNGGPFSVLLANTPTTSATFTGQIGHTYAFYSIARDLVGNVEAPKATADATTQVALACATDVSSSVAVTRSGYSYSPVTRRYAQTITLKNATASAITGPISLVVDNLSSNATLFNASGSTACVAPVGSPYVSIAGPLSPGESSTVTLQFSDPSLTGITYSPDVVAGTGDR